MFVQYPPKTETVFSYIESRGGKYDETVFFGIQAFIKEYLSKPITMANIDDSLKRWVWTVRKSRRLAKYGHISYVVESGDLGDTTDEYVANLVKEYA
jgi:YesN/AraC family two-component response regulator